MVVAVGEEGFLSMGNRSQKTNIVVRDLVQEEVVETKKEMEKAES